MNERKVPGISVIAAILACLGPGLLFAQATEKRNVLFIASDDLRPQLGCYGYEGMITPHLDALAARGMVFERAYCQSATCRASRLSLLTGRRPDTTGIHTNGGPLLRSVTPDLVTLPQHFKNHGWTSISLGKIYHGAFQVRANWNDPTSWSRPEWWPGPRYYYTEKGIASARAVFEKKRPSPKTPIDDWVDYFVLGDSWEAPDVADNVLYDGQVADKAIEVMRELKDEPFFLGVGFLKPHLPFIAPKKYWDLYPPGSMPPATNLRRPEGGADEAITNWGHPRTYTDFPNKGFPSDELVATLTRGYAACVSYVDAQVGRVLAELDRLGLRENTIVVFWGDHGYHLGENEIWGKATNFELTTRVPLIVSAPGMKSAGGKSRALVELVDLYPTLVELADLPEQEELEGVSLVPLLDDPARDWKTAAFSQFPNKGAKGRSIRTDRWRLTRWTTTQKGKRTVTVELYDLENDPQCNVNVAGRDENAAVVRQLTVQLEKGWKGAAPAR
jgi:arylsulfatase A-like enzyme